MSDRVERITVTVEPWHFYDRKSELMIEVRVGQSVCTSRQILDTHDVESLLEHTLKRACASVTVEVRKQLEAK